MTLWKTQYTAPMSTALVYFGLPEGFIIGADGRAFDYTTNDVRSNTERKIFAFQNDETSVVFGWAGTALIGTVEGSFFSFVQDTLEILPTLNFKNNFAEQLNFELNRKLRSFRVNEIKYGCTYGVFLSFRRGCPWVSIITAGKNGHSWSCSVEENGADGTVGILSGPDHDFENPKTLDEGEKSISDYLDDCVAHPTELIGGHVHIGKFTPNGFSWIRPPKQPF